jgi:hypothetical protein
MKLGSIAMILALAQALYSQDDGSQVRPPVTKADVQIVQRARAILDSPAKWNRADNRECPAGAKTFSLYCALETATDEVSGNFAHRGAAMQEARFVIDAMAPDNNYDHRLMRFNNDPARIFTEIGRFFDLLEADISKRLANPQADTPIDAGAPVKVTQPGVNAKDLEILQRARRILNSPAKWNRADDQNCPIDAKKFSLFCAVRIAIEQVLGEFDNRLAALQEARDVIGELDVKHRYNSRLMDFNNDPAVRFEDIQKLFDAVEKRLKARMPAK